MYLLLDPKIWGACAPLAPPVPAPMPYTNQLAGFRGYVAHQNYVIGK